MPRPPWTPTAESAGEDHPAVRWATTASTVAACDHTTRDGDRARPRSFDISHRRTPPESRRDLSATFVPHTRRSNVRALSQRVAPRRSSSHSKRCTTQGPHSAGPWERTRVLQGRHVRLVRPRAECTAIKAAAVHSPTMHFAGSSPCTIWSARLRRLLIVVSLLRDAAARCGGRCGSGSEPSDPLPSLPHCPLAGRAAEAVSARWMAPTNHVSSR